MKNTAEALTGVWSHGVIGQTALGNFTNTSKREQVLWRVHTLTDQTGKFVFGKILVLVGALMNLPELLEKEQPRVSDDLVLALSPPQGWNLYLKLQVVKSARQNHPEGTNPHQNSTTTAQTKQTERV